jgi:hypothetical protein
MFPFLTNLKNTVLKGLNVIKKGEVLKSSNNQPNYDKEPDNLARKDKFNGKLSLMCIYLFFSYWSCN